MPLTIPVWNTVVYDHLMAPRQCLRVMRYTMGPMTAGGTAPRIAVIVAYSCAEVGLKFLKISILLLSSGLPPPSLVWPVSATFCYLFGGAPGAAGDCAVGAGRLSGSGAAQVGHVEAGRRGYSARTQARLCQLAEWVPAALESESEPVANEPPAGLTASEARTMRARLRACRHEARQLRYQQAAWPGKAATIGLRRRTAATIQAARPALAADELDAFRVQEWVELLARAGPSAWPGSRPAPRREPC